MFGLLLQSVSSTDVDVFLPSTLAEIPLEVPAPPFLLELTATSKALGLSHSGNSLVNIRFHSKDLDWILIKGLADLFRQIKGSHIVQRGQP